MLENIRIVLSQTSHPGNIGSSARAIKNMGLSNLYLISPLEFPHEKATAMAAGATDILENATVVNTLEDAVGDCRLLIGSSARDRSLTWPMLSPSEAAAKLVTEAAAGPVALLFGTERIGLTNEDLERCHYHMQIPADPNYSSLNLSQAVQVMTYEIRKCVLAAEPLVNDDDRDYATILELEKYYQHLDAVLQLVNFIHPDHPNRIMPRLRRLYNRARVDKVEINILRGILSEIEKSVAAVINRQDKHERTEQ